MTKGKKQHILLLGIAYISFLTLGLSDGAFGIAWPMIRYEMDRPLDHAGFIVVTQWIAYSITSSQVGRLSRVLRLEQIDLLGTVLITLGLFGMAFAPSFIVFMLVIILMGSGLGLVDAGLNAFVAKGGSTRELAWLQCFWGMGSMISPLIMTRMIISSTWRMGYLLIAFVLVGFTVLLLLSLWKGIWKVAAEDHTTQTQAASDRRYLTKKRYPAMHILIFFLYGCFATSLVIWIPTVLLESRGLYIGLVGLFPSVYFAALTGGRLLIGSIANRFRSVSLIRFGLFFPIAGLLILRFSSSLLVLGFVGFTFSPVLASIVRDTTNRFEPRLLTRLVGYQFSALGLGMGVGAFFVGQLLARVSLEALFPILMVFLVLMFLLNEFLERRVRQCNS